MERNHTEQPDGQLFARLQELRGIDQDWQSPTRREQVKKEISLIVFEQINRYGDSHPEIVDAVSTDTRLEDEECVGV